MQNVQNVQNMQNIHIMHNMQNMQNMIYTKPNTPGKTHHAKPTKPNLLNKAL